MKMMNKTSFALAVAAALGVVSPQTLAMVKIASSYPANSTVSTGAAGTEGTPVQFAAEQSGEASLTLFSLYSTVERPFAGDLSAIIPVPASYSVSSNKPLTVRITLTGGATFAAQPYLLCQYSGAVAMADLQTSWVASAIKAVVTDNAGNVTQDDNNSALIVTATTGGLAVSAVGKATTTFNIPVGMRTNTNGKCIVTMAPQGIAVNTAVTAYNVGARGTVDMTVDTTYMLGGVTATISTAGTLLKFVTALKAAISPKDIAGTVPVVSINVQEASKKFEIKSLTTPTLANLGSVRITSANPNASIRVSSESAAGWNVTSILTTATVTINGNLMAGVQKISLHPAGQPGCTNAATFEGAPSSTTAGGGSVSVTGIAIGSLTAGLNICAVVDGSKVLDAGQLTAVLTGGGVSNFVPDLGAEADIVKVSINGARLRVLNIPAVGATESATLRFYNTSSQDIVVTGTLYGQDGKELGTPNSTLFSALKSNDVEVLTAAVLAQKFGIATPWTGRAWLLVQAQVDANSFKVMSLIRSANGTLINMSTDTSN